MNCHFCGKPDNGSVCSDCVRKVQAAKNAREVMEQRLAELEDKIAFVMNFFRPAFKSRIVGAPDTIMTLLEYYERRKLDTAAQAEEQTQTGIINA